MRKYPIYKQDNHYSCGAYCIKMILKYHHLDIKTKEIKERCRLTSEGISVYVWYVVYNHITLMLKHINVVLAFY